MRTARRISPGDGIDLGQLYEQMRETLEGRGVGLAAPQVGISVRFFIASVPGGGDVRAFVNPQIISSTGEKETNSEGCLSFPGVYAYIERPAEINLRYEDLDFAVHEEQFDGLFARVIQHEVDHLNGVLISDRAIDGLHPEEEEDAAQEDADGAETAPATLTPTTAKPPEAL